MLDQSAGFILFTSCSALLCLLLVHRCFAFHSKQKYGYDYFALSGVPPPKPLPKFKIEDARPRPYRPFRWRYFQNMALKQMEPDYWIELESTYRERIAQRKELYSKHGKTIVNRLPGSELACTELMEMVIQFLLARYPNCFELNIASSEFYNSILGVRVNIKQVDSLNFLLEHVPEDFVIMQENPHDGKYYLTAGVSTSAVGWNMAAKMGKPLHEIHGPVPDYKQRMEFSMDRYFTKLTCDKPIQRGSWGFEIGQPLFLQEDDPEFAKRRFQDPDLEIEDIYLRVDWQTLRRLPRSNAIAFNFKALFTPVEQLRTESHVPHLILKVLEEGQQDILKYKGTWHVEHKLIPALTAWAKEQEDKGWVVPGWEVATLDDDPFFPGSKNACIDK